MSENVTWQVEPDYQQLPAPDSGVPAEVEDRLRTGNLAVREGSDPADPLQLAWRAKTRSQIIRVLLATGIVLVFLALMGMFLVLAGPVGGLGAAISLVVAIGGAVWLGVAGDKVVPERPTAKMLRTELARQLRVAEVARANGARYCVARQPGSVLFPGDNPLDQSLLPPAGQRLGLSPRQMDDAFRPADSTGFPAEWSGYTIYANRSVLLTQYLVVGLPRAVPHIVLDSKANNQVGSDLPGLDPAQRVRIDDTFDRSFVTYAPAGSDQAARDLLTPAVRQGLLEVARDWNVEILGRAVVFFRTGGPRWQTPADWVTAGRLRDLVENVMYARLGEFAGDMAGVGAVPGTVPGTIPGTGAYPVLPGAVAAVPGGNAPIAPLKRRQWALYGALGGVSGLLILAAILGHTDSVAAIVIASVVWVGVMVFAVYVIVRAIAHRRHRDDLR